jgi:hypothetical protein
VQGTLTYHEAKNPSISKKCIMNIKRRKKPKLSKKVEIKGGKRVINIGDNKANNL